MNTSSIDLSSLPDKAPDFDLRALLEAGCHFGHQKSKWHPQMAEYVYMEKDGIHIFDLAKTAAQMKVAYNYLYKLGQEGKTVVVVGTKRQARDIVQKAAEENGLMYITSRWLGGMLTNWGQVYKSLKRMLQIEKGLAAGEYDAYTKFERVQLEKEVGRLQRFFAGIKQLTSVPDVLFVIDPVREKNVIKEAQAKGVPIVAIVDSNADPREADIVIPANDDAMGSITLIVESVLAGYGEGAKAKPSK